MGKTSSVTVPTPAFSGGSVSLNGQKKATVSRRGNDINSNFDMNDYEKAVYDYAQKNLAQNLPNLNVFDNNTKKDINAQVEAYKQKAMQSLNEMYQPMLKNLTNGVASRFGNVDNSAFLDGLSALEKYRSSALASIAQDVQSQQSTLFNNELSNRYNYINLLNALQNQTNTNALSAISSVLNLGNSGKGYTTTSSNLSNNLDLQTVASLAGFISML